MPEPTMSIYGIYVSKNKGKTTTTAHHPECIDEREVRRTPNPTLAQSSGVEDMKSSFSRPYDAMQT